MATKRDGCVVRTAPLSEMVRAYLAHWLRTHPPSGGQFGGDKRVDHQRGVVSLAERANVTVGSIENIVDGRYVTTQLYIADRIATALGLMHEISDGGLLEPFPNLNAPLFDSATGRPIRGGADGRCGCSGATKSEGRRAIPDRRTVAV